MKNLLLRILCIIGIVLGSLILLLVLYMILGRIIHANQVKITSENGIQEKTTIEINGITEELSIRGEDQSNPVILFLHGGPGSPVGYLDYLWQPCLNDSYTIVTYAQRGAGRTYYANPDAPVSIDLILSDVDAIVDYLRERFHQDKIILMGHSWGTLLGTMYVHDNPGKISSYIGVGQVVNTKTGDQSAIDEAVKRAQAAGDTAYIEQITAAYEAFCKTYTIDKNFMTYRNMEPKYLRGSKEKTYLQLAPTVITSPDMNMQDAKWFFIDSDKILTAPDNPLISDMFRFDATQMCDYQVPMYFISGGSDYVTPFSAVEQYYQQITAPDKNFILIDGAGHNTFADVPEEFAAAVKQLLH